MYTLRNFTGTCYKSYMKLYKFNSVCKQCLWRPWKLRTFMTSSSHWRVKENFIIKQKQIGDEIPVETLPPIIRYLQDKRILFNSFIQDHKRPMSFLARKRFEVINLNIEKQKKLDESLPFIVQKLKEIKTVSSSTQIEIENESYDIEKLTAKDFPYSQFEDIIIQNTSKHNEIDYEGLTEASIQDDIAYRLQEFEKGNIKPVSLVTEHNKLVRNVINTGNIETMSTVMGRQSDATADASDNYDGEDGEEPKMKFGTCDPTIAISDVPCGGCGALLHCQDPGLPGFKPCEVFVDIPVPQLRSTVCQRCHFLTNHNIALQVRVSPEKYLDLLQPIKNTTSLVLLLVDLTDAPCSLHPRITEIIGLKQPVVVVGSKVDLLPADGPKCIIRITKSLEAVLKRTSLAKANVRHTCLVSARTGFGIEQLISTINKHWGLKGDIYLVGSTNSGKSTLFNALLASDMCETKASNLILRATTSPWPGTTLNMLKFPLLRLSGRLVGERLERLRSAELQRKQREQEFAGTYTTNTEVATLVGDIGRTFRYNREVDTTTVDIFATPTHAPKFDIPTKGINEHNQHYRYTNWCHDTPGALQPDQFLSLLTHEELMLVLPRTVIHPRSYLLHVGRSLFIAGLGRLDLLHLEQPKHGSSVQDHAPSSFVRITVFSSPLLPVSIVPTVSASAFYRDYLGGELLAVPFGSQERLKQFPPLKPTGTITFTGVADKQAVADFVMSSAGWMSVSLSWGTMGEFRQWTPGGRGAYTRAPPFLPHAVKLRGRKFKNSLQYDRHTLYCFKN